MKAKLLAALTAVKNDLVDTYKRSKIFLLAIGAAIIYFEYSKLMEDLLSYMDKRQMKKTDAKDDTLKAQEGALNTAADQLVQDATSLPKAQEPVTDPNWYKKDSK